MKKSLRHYYILLSLFIIQQSMFSQTGWVKEKNEIYAGLSLQLLRSSRFVNLNGDELETTVFTSIGSYLYSEYGITNRLTVIADFPVIKIQGYSNTNYVSGIGDLSLGLKYGLLTKKFPLAITVMPEFPIGNSNLYAVNKVNSFEFINLPTGDGEFNIRTTLAVSHSFYPKHFYLSAFSGYNFRTGYDTLLFHDQFSSGIEAGADLNDWWLIIKSGVQKTIGKPNSIGSFTSGDGTSFSYNQIELNAPISKNLYFGVRYAFYSRFPVDLINLYRGSVFGITLSYKGILLKNNK